MSEKAAPTSREKCLKDLQKARRTIAQDHFQRLPESNSSHSSERSHTKKYFRYISITRFRRREILFHFSFMLSSIRNATIIQSKTPISVIIIITFSRFKTCNYSCRKHLTHEHSVTACGGFPMDSGALQLFCMT